MVNWLGRGIRWTFGVPQVSPKLLPPSHDGRAPLDRPGVGARVADAFIHPGGSSNGCISVGLRRVISLEGVVGNLFFGCRVLIAQRLA